MARQTAQQHTAHHQGESLVICYPYHPLYGQRVLAFRKEMVRGVSHYRVVTESGQQRLVPQWMFDPSSFDAAPVPHPFLDPATLLDLHTLVDSALSFWGISRQTDPEEKPDESDASLSPARKRP